MRKRRRSVEPRRVGGGGGVAAAVVPRWIRHCCRWSGTEAVVHEVVDMVRVGVGATVHHRRLKVRAFRVLPFAFVRVLVAAEGLRGGEVSAAVVALEAPAALAAGVDDGGSGGDNNIILVRVERGKVVVVIIIVGGRLTRLGVVGGDDD